MKSPCKAVTHNIVKATLLVAAFCVALAANSDGSGSSAPAPLAFEATGFFRVENDSTRWWLVDPQGRPFYSVGVNHMDSDGYIERGSGRCPYCESIEGKYGDVQEWRNATVDRMVAWGFNTVGAWSDRDGFDDRVAQTPVLDMSGGVSDFFSGELEQRARSQVESNVVPYRDAPWIIGWFTDNEMDWGKDWRSSTTRLEDYLQLPEGAPGRAVAETYRGDPDGFLLALATRYFQVTSTVLREADPNHLVLGARSSTIATPTQVAVAAGPWLDVFSLNYYDLRPGFTSLYGYFNATPVDGWLARYHELSGLPLMITEFTYRSRESDVPNTYPPIYVTFATQAERGEAYRRSAERSFDAGYIVGHHWFEYYDDPAGGRFDGEDSNFGLVNNADEPYSAMIEVMTEVNQYAPHLPLGQQRTAERLAQPRVDRLGAGVIVDVHKVQSIQLADGVPKGRYTFEVADPDPATGTAWVQLLRDGVPVQGVGASYPTRFQLSPTANPAIVYTFDFPGYFKLGLTATPGPFTWVSLFNVYNTVFDGVRFLDVKPFQGGSGC